MEATIAFRLNEPSKRILERYCREDRVGISKYCRLLIMENIKVRERQFSLELRTEQKNERLQRLSPTRLKAKK